MSANTETTGAPPKGYMKCGKKCGRYAGVGNWCWECRAKERPIGDDEREVTMLQYPDWTPPIAAPAAHVERRKGQRWKWERNGITWVCELISGSGYAWNARGCDGYSGEGFLVEADWTGSAGAIMTLLADAPPEPAMGVPHPKGCRCKQCEQPIQMKSPPAQEAPKQWREHARCGFPIVSSNREAAVTAVGKHQATCEKCSAQEAPKAAPGYRACGRCGNDAGGLPWCERCMNDRVTWMRAQAGKPYAGPERLPRPQLAADWVEDCLPESNR